MSETERLRKGRKLSAVSASIIIYVLAGGDFSDEGSFLGGAVHFENPSILEYALLIVFIYFFYRFWIAQSNRWGYLKVRVVEYLGRDNKFREYADSKVSEHVRVRLESDSPIKIAGNLINKDDDYTASFDKHRGNSIKGLVRSSEELEVTGKILRKNGANIEGFYVPIQFKDFNTIYFKKWLYLIFQTDDFWDMIFPLLLASGAFISILSEIISRFN